MTAPPLALAAAALLWGVLTGAIALGCLVAFAGEAWRATSLRWSPAPAVTRRIVLANALVLGAALLYALVAYPTAQAMLTFVRWLPVLALPLFVAVRYSRTGALDPAAIGVTRAGGALGLEYPLLALCLLGAATNNAHRTALLPVMALVIAYAAWPVRPAGRAPWTWIVAVVLAAALGSGGALALNRLQHWLVNTTVDLLAGEPDIDPFQRSTALGQIGWLKQSDRILMRVRSTEGAAPALLHAASFDDFGGHSWRANRAHFTTLPGSEGRWRLGSRPASGRIEITRRIDGEAVLALPAGAVELSGRPGDTLQRNRFGAVRIATAAPGWRRFTVAFAGDAAAESDSDAADLQIPDRERATLADIAARLGLSGLAPREQLAAVAEFFRRGFTYSLYQEGGLAGRSPITDFLTRTHSGHCEFFATATVLLLREAGIPARYASGFSLQERSPFGDGWVVRARHAHAWARAWIGGRWVDLDTTPVAWVAAEAAESSIFEPLLDLWEWLRLRWWEWRAALAERRAAAGVPVALGLGAIAVLLALRRWRRARRQRRAAPDGAPVPACGADSEYYLVERALADAGLARGRGEPVASWASRLAREVPEIPALEPLVALHNRYRFDPDGLDGDARASLAHAAADWLDRWRRMAAKQA